MWSELSTVGGHGSRLPFITGIVLTRWLAHCCLSSLVLHSGGLPRRHPWSKYWPSGTQLASAIYRTQARQHQLPPSAASVTTVFTVGRSLRYLCRSRPGPEVVHQVGINVTHRLSLVTLHGSSAGISCTPAIGFTLSAGCTVTRAWESGLSVVSVWLALIILLSKRSDAAACPPCTRSTDAAALAYS